MSAVTAAERYDRQAVSDYAATGPGPWRHVYDLVYVPSGLLAKRAGELLVGDEQSVCLGHPVDANRQWHLLQEDVNSVVVLDNLHNQAGDFREVVGVVIKFLHVEHGSGSESSIAGNHAKMFAVFELQNLIRQDDDPPGGIAFALELEKVVAFAEPSDCQQLPPAYLRGLQLKLAAVDEDLDCDSSRHGNAPSLKRKNVADFIQCSILTTVNIYCKSRTTPAT